MTRSTLVITLAVLILSVSVIVHSQKVEGHKTILLPDRNPNLPFSDGVMAGNTLYLAGKLGLDPKTGKVPESVEAEIVLILDGMKATLEAAGMSMQDVVYVQVFSPRLDLYDQFNAVYKKYFTQNFPARAFIGSGPLLREARFEVTGIAVKR